MTNSLLWTPWPGSQNSRPSMPSGVKPNTVVEVKLRDGSICAHRADKFEWEQ